jgi:hypothetical protein
VAVDQKTYIIDAPSSEVLVIDIKSARFASTRTLSSSISVEHPDHKFYPVLLKCILSSNVQDLN